MLKINELKPNKPANKGSKGSFIFGVFNIIKPIVPENKNIVKVKNLCFSFKIKIIVRIIKIICMWFFRKKFNIGKIKIKIGMKIQIIIIENKVPNKERNTASWAFPSSNNLCAGNIIIAVSSFGTPKKIEGIVSKNKCVIDIDIIIIIKFKSEVYFNKKFDKASISEAIKFI